MTRTAFALVVAVTLLPDAVVRGQQGAVQVSGSMQAATGDPSWLLNGQAIQPDIGLMWQQPGTRFGTALLDAHMTSRHAHLRGGRASLRLQDWKRGSTKWTLGAGDLTFTPSLGDYHFTNLSTPPVAFTGGGISVTSERTTFNAAAGQTSLVRDIFGNDPIRLGQGVAVASLRQRVSDRLDVSARASRVRTTDLGGLGYTIAASDQVGGGARYAWTPSLQLVADASYVSFLPVGAPARRRDVSALVGASWLLGRGWVQVNATRFSPGELPTLNVTLQDRQGLFAAGEYDLGPRLRVFSGWDSFRTNIDPAATVRGTMPAQLPIAFGARSFGGARIRIRERSSLVVRLE